MESYSNQYAKPEENLEICSHLQYMGKGKPDTGKDLAKISQL